MPTELLLRRRRPAERQRRTRRKQHLTATPFPPSPQVRRFQSDDTVRVAVLGLLAAGQASEREREWAQWGEGGAEGGLLHRLASWTSYGPDREASIITPRHHRSTTAVGYSERSRRTWSTVSTPPP